MVFVAEKRTAAHCGGEGLENSIATLTVRDDARLELALTFAACF